MLKAEAKLERAEMLYWRVWKSVLEALQSA